MHDNIGMELDFETFRGTLIISMIKYLQKKLDEFPEALRGTKACPAGDNLFKIRNNEERGLLPEEMARQLQQTTAQLLFIVKRSRTDVKTLVYFLATRVK